MGNKPLRNAFNKTAIQSVLREAGLPLAKAKGHDYLQEQLNEIANEYYWEALNPPDLGAENAFFTFDAVADLSVTPSRLKNRLVGVERAAKRVFAGTSPRPMTEKVTELLQRLGYNQSAKPLRYSGTEKPGHGGSERSAVWLCLVRAVAAAERPPKGYRPKVGERPWASQRLDQSIKALSEFVQSPEFGIETASAAALCIHAWAQWGIPKVASLLAPDHARHQGLTALDATLLKLGRLYREVFEKGPSLSRRVLPGGGSVLNPWERFLQAVLRQILAPEPPPDPSALQARWRRLSYTGRKNRF